MSLQSQIKSLLEQKKYTMRGISTALGVSHATLSLWLNDKYTGNNNSLRDSVINFLERESERNAKPRSNQAIPFCNTTAAQSAFNALRSCHLNGEIGVITAEAGYGKTTACKAYTSRYRDAILIQADLSYSTRITMQQLHKKLNMNGEGSIHAMLTDIIDRLNESGRLLIIDEAEHLPVRALDLIRTINDRTGIGIALVGLPRLIHNLRGKKGEHTYLYSRVGFTTRLEPLQEDDTRMIVTAVGNSSAVAAAFHASAQGCARRLSKLIFRTRSLCTINNLPLDKDMVRTAATMII